jgi:TIGR03009 family protein
MRVAHAALTTLLLAAAPAAAQAPPGQAQPPAQQPTADQQKLDAYLLRWEQEMTKVQTLGAELHRTEKDPAFNSTRKYFGFAQYMKSGSGPGALNMAMLQMSEEGKKDFSEKYVCTGTYLYNWHVPTKEVRIFELPKPQPGQVGNDSFLHFLFGMRAADAKARYNLKFVGEDDRYIYIEVLPRQQQDVRDFKAARIVLYKENFLPRQLWFQQPDGTEVEWDVPKVQAGVNVDRRLFDAPDAKSLPPGWKPVQMPSGQPTPQPGPGRN